MGNAWDDKTFVVILDTETTGLEVTAGHVPWEIAAVRAVHLRSEGVLRVLGGHSWQVKLTEKQLNAADSYALEVGRFHARYDARSAWPADWVGDELALLCRPEEYRNPADPDSPVTLRPRVVGSKPSFDMDMVAPLIRAGGGEPGWYHHPVDTAALCAGWAAAKGVDVGDWRSETLSLAVGVDPARYDRHSAAGDVAWEVAKFATVYDLRVEGDWPW